MYVYDFSSIYMDVSHLVKLYFPLYSIKPAAGLMSGFYWVRGDHRTSFELPKCAKTFL